MSTVKSAENRNENLGMRHYRENYMGIENRRDWKVSHERAKSASTYQSLISRKEIEEAGGDYKTLLRLKKKIAFGGDLAPRDYGPYRGSVNQSVTLQSNRNNS